MKMEWLASLAHTHRRVVSLIIGIVILSVGAVAMAAIISGGPGGSSTGTSVQVTVTQVTINRPSGVSDGDLLIAGIAINGVSTATVTPPDSSWVQIASTANEDNVRLVSYRKIISSVSGEPSSYTWTISGQATASGGITRYSGVDTSNPIDTVQGNTGFGLLATTSVITTSDDNEEIINFFAVDAGKNTLANAYFSTSTGSGMTENYDVSSVPNGPSAAGDDAMQASAGTVSSMSSTIAGTKARNWASQVIALRVLPATINVVSTGSHDNGLNGSGVFTVNSGGGTACFIGFGGHTAATTTSLTWGGSPMTEVARNNSQSPFHGDVWYIKNPPSGFQTLSYTFSESDNAVFGWVCTTGEAASPIGAIDNTSGGNSISELPLSVTTTAPNSLIIGTLWNNNNAGTMSAIGTGVTLAWTQQQTTPDTEASSGLYQTTTSVGTYTPTFSWSNTVGGVAGIGVEVLVQ